MLLWHLTRIYEPVGNQFLLIELYQYVKPLVSVLSFLPPFHLVPAASLTTSPLSPFSLPSTWYLLPLSLSLTTSSLSPFSLPSTWYLLPLSPQSSLSPFSLPFTHTLPPTLPTYILLFIRITHFPLSQAKAMSDISSAGSPTDISGLPQESYCESLCASNYTDPYFVHHVCTQPRNSGNMERWKDEGSKMHYKLLNAWYSVEKLRKIQKFCCFLRYFYFVSLCLYYILRLWLGTDDEGSHTEGPQHGQ